eukprot:CAMPEP_0181197740 /NCGR_PEP_ID=MMETSP1096-20121128/16211_1 /TAXON_ID=156174 ORGANISM="Chrysochromulina ericina, Strain CCMP281" /NCGR_SAMPLE_ID=MMETSP1096 /ASSEMBLY_ACC=CAM_ASM_000453 /LENGTH=112 /DNA_ID=CAMNT_0023287689 /DNA_START=828 /DNA_END=1166 /DNA_ORIENTATION=-
MALKRVQQSFGLQIPQIHFAVLRTADDHVSSSSREIVRATKLLVFMTGIRAQAFSLVIIPQSKRRIKEARKDETTVGREFDERHRWVVVVNKSLKTLARGSIPDATQPIVRR